MACNTVLSSLVTPSALALSSTSSAFVGATPSPSMLVPVSPACSVKPLAVSCSAASNKETTPHARNAILTGLVAAGAALSVFTAGTVQPVQAAVGPGGSGAERTAQKAQDLLGAADKLNVEEAPPRYGPGRVPASAEQAKKVAQDAGGKALSNIKEGVSELGSISLAGQTDVQGAAEDAASKVKGDIDNATSSGGGLFGSIRSGIEDIKQGVESKNADAKKTLDEATDNAGGKLSQIKGGVSELGSISLAGQTDVQGAAEDAASKVKGDIDNATSSGGGLFGSIKSGIEDFKQGVESKNADAKKTLDEASSKVQNTVQQ